MAAGTTSLLERDGEQGTLEAAVRAAARREGSLVLVQGAAGIGKTALLRAGRRAAAEAGAQVLQASGSALDRAFPFGLVHQLLDPVMLAADAPRREHLLRGAAALAGPVLLGGATAPAGADPEHGVLHGLYWALANLAEEAPLALLVDDLHWGDRASLRWLEFVGRRLEGIPVAVLAGSRTGEPGAEEDLLGALAAGPVATVVSPAPLSRAGVEAVVREAIGAEPEPSFADACAAATGGNPLLVAELGRAAADGGLTGAGAEAGLVAGLGAAGVAGHVRRRLSALGEDARDVAAATAILGERAGPADVAVLAGTDEPAASAAADRLVGAGLLAPPERPGGARRFVHPLVREAVLADLPAPVASDLHARAAARGRETGVRADQLGGHLLRVDPAGQAWVVEALRAAAATATAEGDVRTAATLLRRALEEPPPAAERAELLLALGELEVRVADAAAPGHLREALEGLEGEAGARARALLGQTLLQHDTVEAFAALSAAMDATADPALRMRVETTMLDVTIYDLRLYGERAALLAGEDDPSAARLAHLAVEAGYAPGPQDLVEGLVRRALAAEGELALLGAESAAVHLMALAARNAELPETAAAVQAHMEGAVRRDGSAFGLVLLDHARALWHWSFGSLATAESHARAVEDAVEAMGIRPARLAAVTVLVEVLRERGDRDAALALATGEPLPAALEGSIVGADFLSARGTVRWETGDRDGAEADLRQAQALLDARGWRNPHKGRAGLRLAELLAETGRADEARELAEGIVAVADAAGLEGARGMGLRVLARAAEDPAAAEATLETAVAALETSPLALERAWALHDLGRLQRRDGRRTQAREALRRALELAERLGAGALAEASREELLQAGARPRRAAMSGPGSLTPSERRVAEHAARGLSNREIAETLWLSRKTVEVHLGHAYGKLGIRSRAELSDALG